MKIHDLSGAIELSDVSQIADRLRSVRNGTHGVCYIAGDANYPYVAVHFNGDVAYLHYFPSDDHPGFQPFGMTPANCADSVHFLNIDGLDGGAFDMPASTLVDANTAVSAVLEFVANQVMPESVNWFEL